MSKILMRSTMLMLMATVCVSAADGTVLNDADKKKALALIKDLASDDFDVRDRAADTLIDMGEDVIALVKEASAAADNVDLKSSCESILTEIKLETDPEAIVKAADQKLVGEMYVKAARLYEKAWKLYKERASEAKDDDSRGDLLDKEFAAKKQFRRAQLLAGNAASNDIVVPPDVLAQAVLGTHFKSSPERRSDEQKDGKLDTKGVDIEAIDPLSSRSEFKPLRKKSEH